MKLVSPARNAWAVGARAVDAQHAVRPRVGSIGTQAQAREGWRGDTFRRGRPRSLPQQQTRASASCSTSAARRPCTATDATSLTAGLAFASSSPPSLQHRRSRRRWLPARHPAACPVTRPSRPDHRMAPSATSLRLRRRGAGVHSGRRCGHGSRGGSTKLRTTTLSVGLAISRVRCQPPAGNRSRTEVAPCMSRLGSPRRSEVSVDAKDESATLARYPLPKYRVPWGLEVAYRS